jgi:hypothetical protein
VHRGTPSRLDRSLDECRGDTQIVRRWAATRRCILATRLEEKLQQVLERLSKRQRFVWMGRIQLERVMKV